MRIGYGDSPPRSTPAVAPEEPSETLHNLLHNPRLWRLSRGIIDDFFDAVWSGERRLQWEMSRFLAESALVPD
jgi:hypothetical protein